MPNQPVRYSRHGPSLAGSLLAMVLMIVVATGVLIGTVSFLAAGMGVLDGHASARPGTGTLSAQASGGTATATPTTSASPHGSAGPPGSSPSPTPEASPPGSPVPVRLDPPPQAGPFSLDLYRKHAFVSELKPIYCVPAAMQTMINIMSTGPTDRSVATQMSLYQLARDLSGDNLVGDGAEPEGWAAGLDQLGFGPYVVDVEVKRTAAVKTAAIALRMTGRPVGLLTWRGAHSWVMSGFTATADPAWTSDFAVTGVFVEDVWFPRVSSIWGSSLPPDSLDSVEDLHIDYLPWRRPTHRYPDKDGQFVLVLPTTE